MSSSLFQESEDLLAGTAESAPPPQQQEGSDDEEEEELTPAEVVQRMKVGLLPLSTFG